MYLETKKINVIAEVLKVEDESTLDKIESVLKEKKPKKRKTKNKSIYDFVGILTDEEAAQMKRAIKESCETIHPDDWK